MKRRALGMGLGILASWSSHGLAYASGLEVFRQNYGVLFESGNVVQFDGGYVTPFIRGTVNAPGFGPTGSVAPPFGVFGFAGKYTYSDALSLAIIAEKLDHANLSFSNFALGPVNSNINTAEYTGLMRYKFNENWSMFGGLRFSSASATVNTFGFSSRLSNDLALGYTVGGAYEVTELGSLFRLAYKSPITHSMTGSGMTLTPAFTPIPVIGPVDFQLPQSVMVDGRMPIFENTFALFSATWTNWAATKLRLGQNSGSQASATNYDNAWLVEGGLARFLTSNWIAAGWVSYDTGSHEKPGLDTVYSNLVTYSGSLTYLADKYRITGTIGYTTVGNIVGLSSTGAPVSYKNNSAMVYKIETVFKF